MEYISPLVLMLIEHTSNGDMVWKKAEDHDDIFECEDFWFHTKVSPEGIPLHIENAGFALRDLECAFLRSVIDPEHGPKKFTRKELEPYWEICKK